MMIRISIKKFYYCDQTSIKICIINKRFENFFIFHMEDINTCFLCMEPIKYRVLTPCDHNSLCLNCYMRNIICYHHENCYYCQNPLKGYPIVSTDPQITKYAEAKAKKPVFDSQYKLFMTDKDNIRNYIASLFQFVCPGCSLRLPAFDMLASHVKVHRMRVCQICYASNRFLPVDIHVFRNNKEYQMHLKNQHPRCMLCPNQVFFDHDELAKHMLENHVRCEVCAAMNKIVWFKDAPSLVEHHQNCHFVCPHCSSQNLVAFATRGELLIHLKTVHNQKSAPIDLSDFASSPSNNSNNNDDDDDESNNRKVLERRKELNRKFMVKLNELLSEKDKNDLMTVARNYVANKVTGEFFYNEYARYLGPEKDVLFNDMVSFLPIPEKRAELVRIHINYNSSHNILPPTEQPASDRPQSMHPNPQPNQNSNRKNKNQKRHNDNQKRGFKQQNPHNPNQHFQNHSNQSNQVQNQQQDIQIQLKPTQISQIQTSQHNIQSKTNQSIHDQVQPNQQIMVQKPQQQKNQPTISISRSKPPSIVIQRSKPKEEETSKVPPPAIIKTEPQ